MAVILNTAARNAVANALATPLAGGALIVQSAAGDVLASVVLPSPAFDPAVDGVVTLRAVTEFLTTKAGVAARFRMRSPDGAFTVEGTITSTGGVGDVTLLRPELAVGEVIRASGITFRLAEPV